MPERVWWLSFADDRGFMGGCFANGADFFDAHRSACMDGGRPTGGGQCAGVPVRNVPDGAALNVCYGAPDAERFMDLCEPEEA